MYVVFYAAVQIVTLSEFWNAVWLKELDWCVVVLVRQMNWAFH